ELAPAGSRELIETRSSIVVRDVPLRPHQASLFHAHQGRIERSHIETDGPAGDLLETRCDGIAVRWSKRGQSLQEHEVEGSLQDIGLPRLFIRHANGACMFSIGMSNEI